MKIRSLTTAIVLLIVSILLNSCQTEDLGGNGSDPDTTSDFIGTWSVSDQPLRINYSVKIEKHEIYQDQVKLNNFADAGGVAVATAYGNTLVIDKQEVGSGYSVEGEGVLSNKNEMVFEFSLDDGIDSENRKATYTK